MINHVMIQCASRTLPRTLSDQERNAIFSTSAYRAMYDTLSLNLLRDGVRGRELGPNVNAMLRMTNGSGSSMQFGPTNSGVETLYNSNNVFQLQFSTPQDFDEYVTNLWETYTQIERYDDKWKKVFGEKQLPSGINFSEYTLTFQNPGVRKMAPGQEVFMDTSSGRKVRFDAEYYAGGVWFDQRTLETRGQLENLAELLQAAINAHRVNKSETIWNLLVLVPYAGDFDVSWQLPSNPSLPSTSDSYVIERDRATIAKAREVLLEKNRKQAQLIQGENPKIIIAVHDNLVDRFSRALSYVDVNHGMGPLYGSYEIVGTNMIADESHFYAVLPGGRMQVINGLRLEQLRYFNHRNRVHEFTQWQSFGANVGRFEQAVRGAIST